MEEINSTGDGLPLLVKDELCLGRINTTSFEYFLLCGELDVTGTRAKDMTMTSHQDFSASVPVGESVCGGLVD